MIDFSKFIDLSYLLNPKPGFEFQFYQPLLTIFSLFLGLGTLISLVKSIRSLNHAPMIGQWLRWFGFGGLVLIIARRQALPYFSMRIYWFILTFGFFIWLGFIVSAILRTKPQLKEKAIRQETYEKYLPRPKRKA